VVPSEGGWRIDRVGSSFIPGARIGCFGPGGNLQGDSVTHVGFFSQKASVDFLVTALGGEEQPLSPIDPAKILPDRRLGRSGGPGISAPTMTGGRRAASPRGDGLGMRIRAAEPVHASAATAAPLRLTVVNGDLTFERLPLLLGHYNAAKLTGTEKVMDRRIGGTMGQALDLGDYPVGPGTHQIFVNRYVVQGKPWLPPRPKAVIVAGLGQEGSLKGAELTRTVCQGVIAWARQVVEEPQPGSADPGGGKRARPAPLELAATLIGSGGSGITAGQSAQLIAQGVHEANERLRAASSTTDRPWPCVGRLRLVELYFDRANEAWRALRMHAGATPGRYALDDVIECGTGPLSRSLDAGYRGAEYDFITAESRSVPNGEIEIAYALDTKRARTEIRTVSPQGRLVRDLVKTAASDANDDAQIGRTLFKLLVPVELESFLADSTDMQIELDDRTAGIPWELLDDTAETPWAIRTKLLRKLRQEEYRATVKDADADAHALVIGAPECPEEYPPLPGAREEALAVFESLSSAAAFGPSVTGLISDDPSAPGYDARSILNSLFEREWRVVHIAGHGALPEGDGATGGVVLSNGFLGPAEIEAMRVVPELVFVNCCHLGATSNDGVLANGRSPSVYDRARFASSVARELIKIGVRCVIAAGWAVDDTAAKAFASTFYRSLLAGERFIDAVARARREAHAHEGNTWAAYQCYGDPDWRLKRDGSTASSKPSKHEFDGITSVSMLKLALETLLVQKTHQGYESSLQLERLGVLEERWRKAKWSASDGVAELFARVYAAAGDLDAAIGWYDRAIDVADGDVSIRALEQRTNLQVRRAWNTVAAACASPPTGGRARKREKPAREALSKPALEAARATIRDGVDVLDGLMKKFRPTAERANLCGSAMKRLALVEAAAGRPRQELQAIEEMKRYYKRGEELCKQDGLCNLYYPASNYIAAELALNAGRRGWKLRERSLFEDTRQSLKAKNEDDPDFWSIVGEIEIDLYEAIEQATLAKERPSLETRYQDLHARMRGGSDWSSVYDTTLFVLAKYRERATPDERRASDALLTTLEGVVPSPSGKSRPTRHGKARH